MTLLEGWCYGEEVKDNGEESDEEQKGGNKDKEQIKK